MMLEEHEDAFGRAMYDYYHGLEVEEVIERDDGYVDVSLGPRSYLSEYDDWPRHIQKAMRYTSGRVLDIGCGAGRHALYLQDKGLDVLGIDTSPMALKVCEERGLKKTRLMDITQLNRRFGTFDTMLMLGNNFGLFASVKRARWLLRRFRAMTSPDARLIAESMDVYATERPEHLEYHERNRRRGRMPGQVRIRARYRRYRTPWFDYLIVSKEEMAMILEGTGWSIARTFEGRGGAYVAVIEREG
jgi:SAM-dependent methyltransferase